MQLGAINVDAWQVDEEHAIHSGTLGYVNRVLCPFIHTKLEQSQIRARVAKKNGTAERPLIYLVVSVGEMTES